MINFKKGVSVIEVIVSLAILVILLAVTLPSFNTMRKNQVLKAAASEIFSALDKARSQTLSSISSSEYGVHFETSKIVIFKGTTYSSSDATNEEVLLTTPATITSISLTGGASDLYFNRLSGSPNKSGTITITNSSTTKVITISATGAVSMN
jgi:prepilin-type N-terminal cleavage/methylation domain-containing protein